VSVSVYPVYFSLFSVGQLCSFLRPITGPTGNIALINGEGDIRFWNFTAGFNRSVDKFRNFVNPRIASSPFTLNINRHRQFVRSRLWADRQRCDNRGYKASTAFRLTCDLNVPRVRLSSRKILLTLRRILADRQDRDVLAVEERPDQVAVGDRLDVSGMARRRRRQT